MLLRMTMLPGLGIFFFSLGTHPLLQAGNIVKFTSSDGICIFSNTDEIYRSVNTSSPQPAVYPVPTVGKKNQGPQKIMDMIDRISNNHGLDPILIKIVAKVESNYNPQALSNKGAQGIMQLMPSTARRFGVANAFDPSQNIEGGVKYLKFLNKMFRENLSFVLAAYNAGENAVKKYRGIPPFLETQNYVQKIIRLYNQESPQPYSESFNADIISYRDSLGRVIYSNLKSTFY